MFENSMVVQEFIFWMKMDIFIRAIASTKDETIGAVLIPTTDALLEFL